MLPTYGGGIRNVFRLLLLMKFIKYELKSTFTKPIIFITKDLVSDQYGLERTETDSRKYWSRLRSAKTDRCGLKCLKYIQGRVGKLD